MAFECDVILVGGGIANIALALTLLDSGLNIVMIEKGQDLNKRSCPKSKLGKCVHCKPCAITSGFSGAGCYSDCKLTYSSEVGGELINYVGKERFNSLLDKADKLFTEYGGNPHITQNTEYQDRLEYECMRYGMKLLKFGVRHLGTDGSFKVMENIRKKLSESSNFKFISMNEVTDIDLENKTVTCNKDINMWDNQIHASKYMSIAVGRSGSDWLRTVCEKNKIKLLNSSVDIGVRVECPRVITDDVTNNLYEFKIINYSSSGNKVRTFCVNPGGEVVSELYDDCICVNGHSYSDNKFITSNYALLVSCNFTEPFNEPIKYGKSICHLANMLADNKPMVQRLCDLKNKKRSTKKRMERLSYEPTLKDAEPGDFRYVFPSNVVDSIIETLDNLNNVMPGMNGKDTIIYGPEVKFYSSKIELNKNLQTDKFKDVYFIGDSSGVTHGIMQCVMSGIYVGEQILENNSKVKENEYEVKAV